MGKKTKTPLSRGGRNKYVFLSIIALIVVVGFAFWVTSAEDDSFQCQLASTQNSNLAEDLPSKFMFKSKNHELANQRYNLSPSTRCLNPESVLRVQGEVKTQGSGVGIQLQLKGTGSLVVLDFGREVAGRIGLRLQTLLGSPASLGLAFSESSDFSGTHSDASSGREGNADGAILISDAKNEIHTYITPAKYLRGGFRYLTLFLNSESQVNISRVVLEYTPAPTMISPNHYENYFYSNDELLNKIWYAGAHTLQTNLISPKSGRVWPAPETGWGNNTEIARGSSVLVDGAKRDRAVWSGDLGVSSLTAFAAFNELSSVRNSLDEIMSHQKKTGELPMAGRPLLFYDSDAYHLWALITAYNYYLLSGDRVWMEQNWRQYKLAMQFSLEKSKGSKELMRVTGKKDWGRSEAEGENLGANILFFRSLELGKILAHEFAEPELVKQYEEKEALVKEALNTDFWDEPRGAFKDTPNSALSPQDGNSLALMLDVANSESQKIRISKYLQSNWNRFGAKTPEWQGNISNFAGSLEVLGHFQAFQDKVALDLIRKQWGYMLNYPQSTRTFWEGYLADGNFGYGGSYMSHAHGWATGATAALSLYVLGISPTSPGGLNYSVIPHLGDLTHVEGSLTFPQHRFVEMSVDHKSEENLFMSVNSLKNGNSFGVIAVPKFGKNRKIYINGELAWDSERFLGAKGIASAWQDALYIYFEKVSAGLWQFSFNKR